MKNGQSMKLKSLDDDSLLNILERAVKDDVVIKEMKVSVDDESKKILIETSGGDARKMLNTLELAPAPSRR